MLLTSSWFNYVHWRSFYYNITKFTTVLKNPCSYVYISNIYVVSETLKMDNEYFHTTQWTHRFASLRRVLSLSCYFYSSFCSELAYALTFLFHFLLRVFTVYSPSLVFSLISTSQFPHPIIHIFEGPSIYRNKFDSFQLISVGYELFL